MKHFILVMAGGGIGAGLRYGVGLAASRYLGLGFPWGTVICNVAGSLAMGLLVGGLAQGLLGDGAFALNRSMSPTVILKLSQREAQQ